MGLFDLDRHEEALAALKAVKGKAGDLEEQVTQLE